MELLIMAKNVLVEALRNNEASKGKKADNYFDCNASVISYSTGFPVLDYHLGYKVNVCDADGNFKLTHDGFESSNDLAMSYICNSEGTVTKSDVLIYGNSKTTAFTWSYNSEGYLTNIASPTLSFRSLEYTEGNLTTFRNTSFEYGDDKLINHPSAPDVAWAYMAMMENNDPFVYFPYLLGWYTKSSVQLPVAVILPDPIGTGTVRNEITYTFDEEGYVKKMEWNSYEIDFVY